MVSINIVDIVEDESDQRELRVPLLCTHGGGKLRATSATSREQASGITIQHTATTICDWDAPVALDSDSDSGEKKKHATDIIGTPGKANSTI